jgi:hypothetical protein
MDSARFLRCSVVTWVIFTVKTLYAVKIYDIWKVTVTPVVTNENDQRVIPGDEWLRYSHILPAF